MKFRLRPTASTELRAHPLIDAPDAFTAEHWARVRYGDDSLRAVLVSTNAEPDAVIELRGSAAGTPNTLRYEVRERTGKTWTKPRRLS